MQFPRKLLTEGEDIVLELRPHWVALLKPVLWTIIIGSVAGFIWVRAKGDVQDEVRIAVLAISFVLWIPLALAPFFNWAFTLFVLTNERVITRSGVIAKRSKEIPLETINDVTFGQSIIERLLGAGDLVIESAGESGQNRFTNIRKPENVQLEIYRAAEARKGIGRKGGPSLADELSKLADLRDRGVLSDEEFQVRKNKLLET